MFPDFCGAMGFTGWLLMLVLWAGVVTAVVWGVARLFPGTGPGAGSGGPRPRTGVPVGR
jgi:hypothetical protein